MEKGRYMLIHMDRNVYRFKWYHQALRYAKARCHGIDEYCIIVDTIENKVVVKLSF